MTSDIDAAEDWLDAWVAGVSQQAARTADLARQVSALTGQARSADGAITVTVGSTGQVEDLDLTDEVHGRSGRELSREILAVMRAAQRRLSEQVTAEVDRTVGADTETGRAVVDGFARRFPAPPEPSDER
ncbi:YbaB/EbfC family nucleoid-associated protein [Actinoplanes sp. KI2]|uniref:YbaB/EbfC family nucleoid-associated protein n=1 Tax=Actinoplanes sp. KI2 TaxID=2983315 RepID=UPI0021D5EABC|nr:YbaB/EbfC family nucleoid-associated protein [Actinoplanes sp. KI2]MCU7729204.1 YbaB/EbfC family nucleoid-associated protein [Actinoplanes sp. KI2]